MPTISPATAVPPIPIPASAPPLVLGSRGLRLAAMFIDSAVVAFPIFLIATMSRSYAVGAVLYIVVGLSYAPLLLARQGAENGRTIGKQTLGLRVVSLSEPTITLRCSVLRELVGRTLLNLVTLGLYGLVDAAWCLFDAQKQTLHDKIAGTIVVKDAA